MELSEFIRTIENEFQDIQSGSLTSDTRFDEIDNWDSMHALILIARIEEEYGYTISAQQLQQAKTIADLFETVNNNT